MFSPLCLRAGLALLATGTDGETLCQLLSFLGSGQIHQLNAASAGLLAEMSTWPQLSFAAGIFVDHSLRLRPEFQSTAAAVHRAFARSVDFRNQTMCVLANAMHFKAKWAQTFEPWNTERDVFHRLDGTSVRVPFLSDPGMHYAASFDVDGLVQGPPALLQDGGTRRPAGLRHAVRAPEPAVTPCMVPKFKFSSQLDAGGALAQLGLGAPFDPLAADLSRMAVNAPPEGLFVSAMRQTCAVEVDEEGKTAVEAILYTYLRPINWCPAGRSTSH
ncbi:hypothetical protein E2562_029384 [Oryza meyeriana var. granulata]|uniref:Serpin domain-containing protein n=1 Tax=Oryza meyeriana var. granulata TaxID=110450 RepID=A0A6G1C1F1_9ORYZ|nr:hypothetical protein E2562_029384 [Oryza meyeriana var. granulata]